MDRARVLYGTLESRERNNFLTAVACAVITVLSNRHPDRLVPIIALFVVFVVALLAAPRVETRVGIGLLLLATATGLVAIVLVPNGAAEVQVLQATATMPNLVDGRARAALLTLCSLAFGGAIWYASGSPLGLLAGGGVWLLAERTVERAELKRERDRAVALLAEVEASRNADTRAAASEERGRIAREMHDVLAHSLAGLSLQLQAVRAVAARYRVPAEVTGPLDRAAELAQEGVAEARAVVGALRPTGGPDLAALPSLVERFPGQATLTIEGQAGKVAPAAAHAAFRAVQEGLTNAARYAPGAPVTVVLRWAATELVIEVTDQGRPAGRAPSGIQGSGTGLAGMNERIAAAGGSLVAGPAGAGWRVTLRLPAEAGPPPSPSSADGASNGGARMGRQVS